MTTINSTANTTVNKTLSYWFENHSDQTRKIIIRAASKRYPILRSIGIEVEEMVAEVILVSRKSKTELTDFTALGRFLSTCTRNRIYSLGKKAKLRQQLFVDVPNAEGDQQIDAIDGRELFSEIVSRDEMHVVQEAVAGDPKQGMVFDATVAVWETGRKATTANIARKLGWTFHRTARARTDLQMRIGRNLGAGFPPGSNARQRCPELPTPLSHGTQVETESAALDTR